MSYSWSCRDRLRLFSEGGGTERRQRRNSLCFRSLSSPIQLEYSSLLCEPPKSALEMLRRAHWLIPVFLSTLHPLFTSWVAITQLRRCKRFLPRLPHLRASTTFSHLPALGEMASAFSRSLWRAIILWLRSRKSQELLPWYAGWSENRSLASHGWGRLRWSVKRGQLTAEGNFEESVWNSALRWAAFLDAFHFDAVDTGWPEMDLKMKRTASAHRSSSRSWPPSFRTFRSSTRPTVLYFHGNAGTRAIGNRVRISQKISAMDCNFLMIDYRWAFPRNLLRSSEAWTLDRIEASRIPLGHLHHQKRVSWLTLGELSTSCILRKVSTLRRSRSWDNLWVPESELR